MAPTPTHSRPNSLPRPSSAAIAALAATAGSSSELAVHLSSDGNAASRHHSSVGGERPRSGRLAPADTELGARATRSRSTMVIAYKDTVKEDLRILDGIRESASSRTLLKLSSTEDIPSGDQAIAAVLRAAQQAHEPIDLVIDADGKVTHASRPMLARYLVSPSAAGNGKLPASLQRGRPLESRDLVRQVVPGARVAEWDAWLSVVSHRDLLFGVRAAYKDALALEGHSAHESTDGSIYLRPRAQAPTPAACESVLSRLGMLQASAAARQVNALLLLLHWMRTSDGLSVLAANPEAGALVAAVCEDAKLSGDEACQALGKILDKEVRAPFTLSGLAGMSTAADPDSDRLRRMMCCVSAVRMPKWLFTRIKPVEARAPALVASQLTLLMYDLIYRHVTPKMLRARERDVAPPIQDLVRVFKVLSFFPLTMILQEGVTSEKRVDLLVFWLDVAYGLHALNNFHGFFGVMGGLTQPMLRFLWDMVPAKHAVHKRLEELRRAFSPLNDYRVYRADLSKSEGKSCIPFLGMSNRRLALLETAEAADGPAMVDFANVQLHRDAVEEFLQGQKRPYSAVKAGGKVFYLYAGPPGPSPYALHESGVVLQAPLCNYPPATPTTLYPAGLLQAVPRVLSGCIELPNDDDLRSLIAARMSETLTEDTIRQLADIAKSDSQRVVVDKLEAAGFLY